MTKGPSIRIIGASSLWFLAILALVSVASAQTVLREWRGTLSSPLGYNVRGVGDVDGDGIPDVAINVGGGLPSAGGVRVYSSRTGSVVWERFGMVAGESHGFPIRTAGDIDRDGAPDIMVGSRAFSIPPPWLTLYSGRTGSVLHMFGPMRGAGPGDVNGDGVPDLLLGWIDCTPGGFLSDGRVELVSGRTFGVLQSWCGLYPNHGLNSVERAGDFDADGVPDLLAAATGNWPITGHDGFWIYSGCTRALLCRVPPPSGSDSFPLSIDAVGDVNADGYDDIAASDIGRRVERTRHDVNVYGGPIGTELFTLRSPLPAVEEQALGSWVAAAGDIDGDGHDDVFTGDGRGGVAGAAFAFSGRDQSLLWQLVSASPATVLVAGDGVGDIDGDDFPDLAMTASGNGWLRIYSGAPDGVATLGTGCADARGIVPRIGMSRPAALGTTCSLNLSRVRPGVPAALLLGASSTSWPGGPLPLELGALGLRGCFLRASPDLVLVLPTRGLGAKGWIAQPVPIPAQSALAGARFFAQWLVLDPLHGASTTRALDVTVVAPGV